MRAYAGMVFKRQSRGAFTLFFLPVSGLHGPPCPFPVIKLHVGLFVPRCFFRIPQKRTTLVSNLTWNQRPEARLQVPPGLPTSSQDMNRTEDLLYNDPHVPSAWASSYEQHRLLIMIVPFRPAYPTLLTRELLFLFCFVLSFEFCWKGI